MSFWYESATPLLLDLVELQKEDVWIMLVDGRYEPDKRGHAHLSDVALYECPLPGYKRQPLRLSVRERGQSVEYLALDTTFVIEQLPIEGYAENERCQVLGAVIFIKGTGLLLAFVEVDRSLCPVVPNGTLTLCWSWNDKVALEINYGRVPAPEPPQDG